MKKRILSVILIICMSASLLSCGAEAPFLEGDKNASASPLYPAPSAPEFSIKDSISDGIYENGVTENESVTIPDSQNCAENPFINTSANNISTFSADVDTASYTYFRKLALGGRYSLSDIQKNFKSAFRTEEWVNYFDYEYTEPTNSVFGVKTSLVRSPFDSDNAILKISMKAAGDTESTANNLVFLIDVSGSMASSDKLELIKKSFSFLTDSLGENDRVSIVTYSGKEEVILEGCEGSKREQIMLAVSSLTASGSTNGESGLKKAYEIAERYFIDGGNNRIILASDGDLNVGVSSEKELEELVSKKRESGVYISVLGFGTGNYKDSKMEAIADNGNGVYHYIDSEAEGERIFGDKLTSTLYTVATDLKLQVKFNEQAVKSYRLIGYENRILNTEDFDDDSKDAGDVGAGSTVTALYELVLSENSEGEGSVANLSVRYKKSGSADSTLEDHPIDNVIADTDCETKFILMVAGFVSILRESKYCGDFSYDTLRELLFDEEMIAYIEKDEYKLEFRNILLSLLKL